MITINAINAPLSGAVTQLIEVWAQTVAQIGLFNINMANSANPGAERAILTEFSYGRQLGRILDVLTPIVKAHGDPFGSKATLNKKYMEDYLDMAEKIDIEKNRHTVSTLLKAIDNLQNEFQDEHQQTFDDIRKELRRLLKPNKPLG